jgi:hypothetical protein
LLKTSIVKLVLHVVDNDIFWNVFGQAEKINSLKVLHFHNSSIEKDSAKAVLMKCWEVESLKELSFVDCKFSIDAIDYLIDLLSRGNFLDTLILDWVEATAGDEYFCRVALNNLQVTNLSVRESPILLMSPTIFEEIATNPFIRRLHLSCDCVYNVDWVSALSNCALRLNRGPVQLVLDRICFATQAPVLAEALEHNHSLKSLTISTLGDSCLVPFARALANMRGLCTLSIGIERNLLNFVTFIKELETSMDRNTTLQTLSLCNVNPYTHVAKRHLPNIRYSLALNRAGRNLFMSEEKVPDGLWAQVLANALQDANGVFFALTGNPQLVAKSRKRKLQA